MKVICAGLPKTGTKSMAQALRMLGYDVHDHFEQFMLDGELTDKIRDDTATVEDYQRILKKVDAVTDMPACGFWEEIHKAFPSAKVILTIRSSEDEWYMSVKNQCEKILKEMPLKKIGVPAFVINFLSGPLRRDHLEYLSVFTPGCVGFRSFFEPPSAAMARAKYRQHNSYVIATCPETQLLVFNVKDGWEPLCNFLDLPIPDTPFPSLNLKGSFREQLVNKTIKDAGYLDAMKKQVLTRLGIVGVAILAFLVYMLQNYIF